MIWTNPTRAPELLTKIHGRHLRSVGCKEDHQCPTGFFCEVSQLSCRKCLRCEDLHRKPRAGNTTSCVTSVTACGACFAGLEVGPADNNCVAPAAPVLLPYEWAVIVIGLLIAIVICVAAVYVLRNFKAFKVFTTTRATVRTANEVEASAPQLPPPYRDVPASSLTEQQRNDDESAPFIKPIPSPTPRADTVRESADNQAARVFNNPSYVRTLQLQPHSYETPNQPVPLQVIPEIASDMNTSFSNNSGNAMALEVEDSSGNEMEVAKLPSEKKLPPRQDNNNNGDEGTFEGGTANTCARASTAFIINVIKNVNTVQQRNDVSS